MSKETKEIKAENKQNSDQTAANTLSEAQGFVAAANVIENLEDSWKDQADTIREEAVILAKAQNAMDDAIEGKPFKPSKETEKLFDDINAIVEAQNDLDNGQEKGDPHLKKMIDERFEPDEWNPETVIDEKIKEEQDRQVSEDLKDEIADALESDMQ